VDQISLALHLASDQRFLTPNPQTISRTKLLQYLQQNPESARSVLVLESRFLPAQRYLPQDLPRLEFFKGQAMRAKLITMQ
jgi:hypothetical protein